MDLLFYRDVMNVRCFLEHTPVTVKECQRENEREWYAVLCVCARSVQLRVWVCLTWREAEGAVSHH